jgi:hypothetical protein
MWHLREIGIARCDSKTISGSTWHEILDAWEKSDRRVALREMLYERDGVHADDVIIPPTKALTLTTFAPTVSAPRLCTPTTLALTLTTFNAVKGDGYVPTTKALTLTAFAPKTGDRGGPDPIAQVEG